MRLDPRALRLFLAVCREGTISGAARALHLSQPSVSVAISQLERGLGTQLFERDRQGIQLLPAGQALLKSAEAMENLLDAAHQEVQLLNQNISGPLVIGGTPGALATLIPKVLQNFTNVHPRLDLRILERPEARLHDLLRSFHLDLAVSTAEMSECPDDLNELAILGDPFSLMVGRENGHLPNKISLADLAHSKWVLPDAVGGFRRQIDAMFINAQVSMPTNVIRSDSLLTTKAIVKNTDYITILPNEVAATELATGTLRGIRIREASFPRRVGILWLKERSPSYLVQSFIEHSRQVANV